MRSKLLLFALALSLLAPLAVLGGASHGDLRVDVLNVGQGDAIFIRTPGGHRIIVDSGPDGTAARDLGRLLPFYDRRIDLAVVTHPQADHYGGFPAIMRRYRIRELLWNGFSGTGGQYQAYRDSLTRHHVALSVSDHRITYDFGDGVRLTTLFPDAPVPALGQDPNETCIITRLEYGEASILLTGDATERLEQTMLGRGLVEPVGVLKVAHHGSRFGMLPEFLARLQPETAVISVGARNTYGHPAPQTMQKFRDAHVRTYRTDLDGTVELISRAGAVFSVQTHALHD